MLRGPPPPGKIETDVFGEEFVVVGDVVDSHAGALTWEGSASKDINSIDTAIADKIGC